MLTTAKKQIGVKLKLERAKHHICDLENRIVTFREANPHLLWCDQDQQTGERVFGLQRDLWPECALIVGDAVHNLRSALDHLACRLVETNGNDSIDRVSFPIYDTPTKFENRPTTQIKGVSPGALSLFEAVQPYQRGYESLSTLSKLDNADKHRLLLVVAYGVQGFGFSHCNAAHPILQDPTIRAAVEAFLAQPFDPVGLPPADRFPVFHGGTELARISWPGGPHHQMDDNLDLTFEVSLAEPEIAAGHPIIKLLTQLSQIVESVANQFIPFL